MNYNFIAPLMIGNSSNNSTIYNTTSLIKMLLLSIVYVVIGNFAFKKRKMENNETSFKNPFIHYLIKGITLFPICFITYAIIKEATGIGWLISIVALSIYSIIYDLITRKENLLNSKISYNNSSFYSLYILVFMQLAFKF